MMKEIEVPIDRIYVPAKRRTEVRPEAVDEIAASILENGLQTPIGVRRDGERFVLVSGLQRLEACRALGEETIAAIVVGTPRR